MWHLVLAAWLDAIDLDKKNEAVSRISKELRVTEEDVILFCKQKDINPVLLENSPIFKKEIRGQSQCRRLRK